MPGTVTRDGLEALADDVRAELAAADPQKRARILARPRPEDPAAFSRYPWTWQTVPPGEVSDVTGYAQETIKGYKWRAAKAREAGTETHRHMPAEVDGGGWEAGALAIWLATRDLQRATPIIASDEVAAAVLADYQARQGMTRIERAARGMSNAAIAQRHGVSVSLAREIFAGRVPVRGRTGTLGARLQRRERKLLPAVRAIARRDGEVTYAAVAAELGIDVGTAKSIIDELGIPLADANAPDAEVSEFIRTVLRRPGRGKTARSVYRQARTAGVKAGPTQVRRLLPLVRSAEMAVRWTPAGQGRARGESLRSDGLLTQPELAADWEVSSGSLTQARRRGDITPAGWDNGRPLWDGTKMRGRTDRGRTPVDAGHRLAVPLPGDETEVSP